MVVRQYSAVPSNTQQYSATLGNTRQHPVTASNHKLRLFHSGTPIRHVSYSAPAIVSTVEAETTLQRVPFPRKPRSHTQPAKRSPQVERRITSCMCPCIASSVPTFAARLLILTHARLDYFATNTIPFLYLHSFPLRVVSSSIVLSASTWTGLSFQTAADHREQVMHLSLPTVGVCFVC